MELGYHRSGDRELDEGTMSGFIEDGGLAGGEEGFLPIDAGTKEAIPELVQRQVALAYAGEGLTGGAEQHELTRGSHGHSLAHHVQPLLQVAVLLMV
jgi:hypothetical protein